MMKKLAAAAALIGWAFVAAACGDGDGPGASTDPDNPTVIEKDAEVGGTVSGGSNGEINHFWIYTADETGTYELVLSGDLYASVNNCGESATAQGCMCVVPECCEIYEGDSCSFQFTLAAGESTIFAVFTFGADDVTYSLRVAGPLPV